VVLTGIAQAEAAPKTDALFAVIDFIGNDDRRAYLTCGARDTTPDASVAQGYVVERVTTINISNLIRIVRAETAKLGLDLSAPFLPAPDSAEFSELVAAYGELEGVVVEARAIRKRDAAAQRVGAKVRAPAMGGAGRRNASGRASEAAAAAI
jgi:hypothetical protein